MENSKKITVLFCLESSKYVLMGTSTIAIADQFYFFRNKKKTESFQIYSAFLINPVWE